MAYSKEKIEDILNAFALTIGISDDLFDAADSEYKALGNWIEKKNTDDSVLRRLDRGISGGSADASGKVHEERVDPGIHAGCGAPRNQ